MKLTGIAGQKLLSGGEKLAFSNLNFFIDY
jgi:hypothetical protein